MARSLLAGSLVALMGAGVFACGGDDTNGSTTGNGTQGSTTGAGGNGGNATTTVSATSSTTVTSTGNTGGAGGGTTTGAGGDGGVANGAGGGTTTATTATATTGAGGDPNDSDLDGDGWSKNEGDCCDTDADCGDPELVNPGAFEYLGNSVDDDCDLATSDSVPVMDCGGNALDLPTSSTKLMHAMELCQETTENPPLSQKKWGVISSTLKSADTSSNEVPNAIQVGVLANYGPNVLPKKFATMAALSSGTARIPGQAGYVHPQNGPAPNQIGNYNAMHQCSAPPAYLAANGGSLPNGACPNCVGANCTTAFDSVNLKARIRVPTNALSFSYNFKFYSAEYPEFVCQEYNDFFVTLLTSAEPSIPNDKNIAFDANSNPVSVNNAFLEVCFPAGASLCPAGQLELIGNGMGGWGANEVDEGGGTVWLTNDSPVVPGETIEIEFVIWDSEDHNVDSIVLLDNFRWDVDPSTVGVHK